jgi:CRP/FNR family nitrogen fixation transcriptional regulator
MFTQAALYPTKRPSLAAVPSCSHLQEGPSPVDLIEALGSAVSYARGEEIYGEKEPALYLYKVLAGSVRSYKVLMDGRRQVSDFHLSGDFFGVAVDEAHTFSAEAITDSKVLVIRQIAMASLAWRNQDVAKHLWSMVNGDLRRVHAHTTLLIKTAKERVAAFLLEMAERAPTADYVDLPMSRQDIADYLGLTMETVSRTLTDLENKRAISLPSSRRVVLRDRKKLDCYGA